MQRSGVAVALPRARFHDPASRPRAPTARRTRSRRRARSSTRRPTSSSRTRSWRSAGPIWADVNGESPAQTRDEPEEESVIDEPEEKLDEQDFEDEEDFADEAMQSGGGGAGRDGDRSGGVAAGGGGELAVPASGAPAHRRRPGSRLINFLQGSWRELQRVQWPDRRQVMQATGVVIGFVIVAGVYLGVADALASKLVNFILK